MNLLQGDVEKLKIENGQLQKTNDLIEKHLMKISSNDKDLNDSMKREISLQKQ